MFLGEYKLQFSGQGRIVLPAKFRDEISGKEILLSRGWEGCIFGYDKKEWAEQVQKQLGIPITEKKGRELRRYIFSAAENIKLDDQGRFVIPKTLVDFAKLKKEVALIGAGDHFEIWNPRIWKKVLTKITVK